MYRIADIGGSDTVIGFKALGLDTFPVNSAEEASAAFNDKALFRRQMAALGIEYSPMSETAAIRAGSIWRLARATQKSKGSTRLAVVPDFLVGAHAMECADALITRDRGFMRRWFTDLTIADPSAKRT